MSHEVVLSVRGRPDALPGALADFLEAIRSAKLSVGSMYLAQANRNPNPQATIAMRQIAQDEIGHAAALARAMRRPAEPERVAAAAPVGCGPFDETWPSALMAAFALDQAATAALLAISKADGVLAATAGRIAADERAHQSFAIAAFKSVASGDPTAGRRIAGEMLVARDWVKQVFPRHAVLAELASVGILPTDAPKLHDSFLASLGDRVQEALGVLGD
jgi:1,2-phenylacetyl-CoA epoxidase catalytic subunit